MPTVRSAATTIVGDPLKRIRFVVTGDLERAAIVASISRWFPAETHEGEPVEWLRPRKVHPATTYRLRTGESPRDPMSNFARAVVAEAWDGADGTPSDLVVAVDDVELHNFDQPHLIGEQFRAALEGEIMRYVASDAALKRMRERVRMRCAFHLISPMVEAYLFGERAALLRAGCATSVEPRLARMDVEAFESVDPAWNAHCATTDARQSQLPHGHFWWREARHAKHYLEHLVALDDGNYDEVSGGVAAFEALAWATVPADGDAVPFARALFEDLSDFFGVTNPLGTGALSPLTYPERRVRRETLALRNM